MKHLQFVYYCGVYFIEVWRRQTDNGSMGLLVLRRCEDGWKSRHTADKCLPTDAAKSF